MDASDISSKDAAEILKLDKDEGTSIDKYKELFGKINGDAKTEEPSDGTSGTSDDKMVETKVPAVDVKKKDAV